MEIAPLSLGSLEAREAVEAIDDVHRDEGLVEARIRMSRVFFESHGSEKNHRPYLHGLGELIGLQAIEEEDGSRQRNRFGYGVDRLNFEKDRPAVSMIYEFTDDQVTELARRGFFNQGYTAPESLETVFELPVQAHWMVVPPDYQDDITESFPLVFVSVEGLGHLEMTHELSGYDLVDEMPDRSAMSVVQGPELFDDREFLSNVPTDDLFAGQNLFTSAPDLSFEASPHSDEDTDFDRALRDQEAKITRNDPFWLKGPESEDFDPEMFDDLDDLDDDDDEIDTPQQEDTIENVSTDDSVHEESVDDDSDYGDISLDDVLDGSSRQQGLGVESAHEVRSRKTRVRTHQKEQRESAPVVSEQTTDHDDEIEL